MFTVGCRRNLQGSNDEKNVLQDDEHMAPDVQQKIEHTTESGTVALMPENKQAAIRTDPFKRLEHLQEDQVFFRISIIISIDYTVFKLFFY